jgi:regulator of replication initiation timing
VEVQNAEDDSIEEQQEQLKKQMEQLKKHLRDNLTLYVTKLKATSGRNDIAHVFSNSFKQTIYKPTHAPIERRKNRSLFANVVDTMTQTDKEELLAMLADLSDIKELPGGFDTLNVAMSLQIYFLRSSLEKWQPNAKEKVSGRTPPKAYPPEGKGSNRERFNRLKQLFYFIWLVEATIEEKPIKVVFLKS